MRTNDAIELATRPRYTLAHAARQIDVAESTLRRWVWVGRDVAPSRDPAPPIEPTRAHGTALTPSFVNLVEAYLVRLLRNDRGLRPQAIARAVAATRHNPRLSDDEGRYPLVGTLLTRADVLVRALLAEQEGRRTSEPRGIVEVVETAGRCIHTSPERPGVPLRIVGPQRCWKNPAIVIDPRVQWGQAVIAGTRVPVEEARVRMKTGDDLEALACEYGAEAWKLEAIRGARVPVGRRRGRSAEGPPMRGPLTVFRNGGVANNDADLSVYATIGFSSAATREQGTSKRKRPPWPFSTFGRRESGSLVQDLLALFQGSPSVLRRKVGLDFVIRLDTEIATLPEHVAQAFQRRVAVSRKRFDELLMDTLSRLGREADASADRQAPVPSRVIGTAGRVPPVDFGFAASEDLRCIKQLVRSDRHRFVLR